MEAGGQGLSFGSPVGAGVYVLGAFVWVASIALWPAQAWRWHILTVVGLGVAVLRHRPSLRVVLRRTLAVWGMSGVIALGLIGQPGAGLRAGNLVLKSTLSLWVLSLMLERLGLTGLLAGLRWLRVPRLLTQTVAFWGRYSSVLACEWQRLQMARQARTFTSDRRFQFQVLAQALGLLFIRAFERAEKVHRAMLARGYRGGPD